MNDDFGAFIVFLFFYIKIRISYLLFTFNKAKSGIISLFIIKRGSYSNSLLNSSFFLLVGIAIVGGPIIADHNPFSKDIKYQDYEDESQNFIAYNPFSKSLKTVISHKSRDGIFHYSVRPGDTLESIANQFDLNIATIRWANDLSGDSVKEGDILKIPPVIGVVHKVSAGDTIYSIANKYRTNAQNIVNFPFNDFENLDSFTLTIGQIVYVPGGVLQTDPYENNTGSWGSVKPGVVGSSQFIWPTSGAITQYPTGYHMALDIANSGMPPVMASDKGTVIYSGCVKYGYGCHVIVDHGNGYQTLYAHFSSIAVEAGEVVNQGQTLGIMGTTGLSTGVHLHFEIRSGGNLLNPLNFLSQ